MNNFFEVNSASCLDVEADNCIDRNECKVISVAICVTIYNEDLDSFLATYLSTLSNCVELHDEYQESKKSIQFDIFLIFDGAEHINEEIIDYLINIGAYDIFGSNCAYRDFDAFGVKLQEPDVRDILGGSAFILSKREYTHLDIKQTCVVKHSNKGKIDTHWIFYEVFGKVVNPTYFVQIDVGIALKNCSLKSMIFHLESCPNVGATAACSLVESPESSFNLLHTWQFSSFLIERTISWPLEMLAGYLSVIPGQLHAVRSKAIQRAYDSEKSESELSFSILDDYFKGDKGGGILRENMYLAEDRIMGTSIVYQNHPDWRIGYSSESKAVVDACETWADLIRQRRRWICGALSCKFYLGREIIKCIRREDDVRRNVQNISVLLFQSLSFFLDWFAPSMVLYVYLSILDAAKQSVLGTHYAVSFMDYSNQAIIAGFFGAFVISVWGEVDKRASQLIGFTVKAQSLLLGLILSVSFFSGSIDYIYAASGFFCALSVLLFAINLRLYSVSFLDFLKILPVWAASFLFVGFFTSVYAVLNMSDTSWGTKGLTKRCSSRQVKNGRRIFKLLLCLVYVSSNGAFLFLISTFFLKPVFLLLVSALSVVSVSLSIIYKPKF